MTLEQAQKIRPDQRVITVRHGTVTVLSVYNKQTEVCVVFRLADGTWIGHEQMIIRGWNHVMGPKLENDNWTLQGDIVRMTDACDDRSCEHYIEHVPSHCRKTNRIGFCVKDRRS